MDSLGTLGGNNSAAVAANNRGLIVGLAENSTLDPNCIPPQVLDYKPVVWRGDTIHELPLMAGDANGGAVAVNDKNQVVGATGMCGSGPPGAIPVHAVLWQNGSVTDLGSLGGAVNNFAYAINNPGQIVGVSDLPGDSTGHAFLWQKGVMTDLGTLPGDFLSIVYGINNKGQVVGQSCDVNFNCRASLWQSGVMIDLNTVTLPGSSLYLLVAFDINSRGEIVGNGVDQSTGVTLAFLAVPCGQDGDVQRCSEVAQTEVDIAKPSLVLPDYIRKGLRQRQGFMRLGFGLATP